MLEIYWRKPKIVDCFQDFKYESHTSEEIYDELYETAKKNGEDFLKELGELLDEHLDPEGSEDDKGEGQDGKDKNGNNVSKGKPKYSKEELNRIKDEVKEGMMQAAQSAGAGNVPGEVARSDSATNRVKMNWRELIPRKYKALLKTTTHLVVPYERLAHRCSVTWHELYGYNLYCNWYRYEWFLGNDQAQDFLGEIKGIMDEFKDYKIKLWTFDTKVYNEEDFSADDGKNLLDYEVFGGGGTDFDCNWKYMKDQDIVPNKFIMFTDGYPWDSWGDDYCDTICNT